jgi:hypothetical protein
VTNPGLFFPEAHLRLPHCTGGVLQRISSECFKFDGEIFRTPLTQIFCSQFFDNRHSRWVSNPYCDALFTSPDAAVIPN